MSKIKQILPSEISDQELIIGIRNGDSRAISKLYKSFFPPIQHMIITNSGSEDEAKDVFQDAVMVLCREQKIVAKTVDRTRFLSQDHRHFGSGGHPAYRGRYRKARNHGEQLCTDEYGTRSIGRTVQNAANRFLYSRYVDARDQRQIWLHIDRQCKNAEIQMFATAQKVIFQYEEIDFDP